MPRMQGRYTQGNEYTVTRISRNDLELLYHAVWAGSRSLIKTRDARDDPAGYTRLAEFLDGLLNLPEPGTVDSYGNPLSGGITRTRPNDADDPPGIL